MSCSSKLTPTALPAPPGLSCSHADLWLADQPASFLISAAVWGRRGCAKLPHVALGARSRRTSARIEEHCFLPQPPRLVRDRRGHPRPPMPTRADRGMPRVTQGHPQLLTPPQGYPRQTESSGLIHSYPEPSKATQGHKAWSLRSVLRGSWLPVSCSGRVWWAVGGVCRPAWWARASGSCPLGEEGKHPHVPATVQVAEPYAILLLVSAVLLGFADWTSLGYDLAFLY